MTPKSVLTLAGVLFVVLAGWAFVGHERAVGALNARLAVADSVSRVAVAAQAVQHDSAVAARRTADSLRDAARREVVRDRTAQVRTDSIIRESTEVRHVADRTVSDSTADRDSLRSTIRGLLRSARSDSTAYAERSLADQRTIAALLRAVASDSTAIQRGVAAENAAIARSVASERQRDLLRSARPSAVGNVLRSAAWVAVGLGVGRLIH